MKTNELFKTKKIVMSAEVFPPKKSGTMEGVIRALKDITAADADFVSITCGAGGDGGFGTSDVASIATDAFNLNTVAHLTCVNLSKDKLAEELSVLAKKSIENILVLRGDVTTASKFYDFFHANELAEYISKNYPQFNLIGACYPEGHHESASLDDDIDNLKRKADSGITHLISQVCFDNDCFYKFINLIEKKGIKLPVQAGIMPVLSATSIQRIVSLTGCSLPIKFTKIMAKYNDEALKDAGITYAAGQIIDLISNGASGVHLYTMNNGTVATKIFSALSSIRTALNG